MTMLQRLLETIRAAAPGVVDVRVGVHGDRSTWRVEPASQQAAAQAAINAFDSSPAAHAAWEENQRPERKAIRQAAVQAIADIDAYLAAADIGTASQIQQRDHNALKRLAQMMKSVIARLIQID